MMTFIKVISNLCKDCICVKIVSKRKKEFAMWWNTKNKRGDKMKKLVGIIILSSLLLVGCGQGSKTYGYMDMDWESFNETYEDCHVYYASSDTGCFSDGSIKANTMLEYWKVKHEEY